MLPAKTWISTGSDAAFIAVMAWKWLLYWDDLERAGQHVSITAFMWSTWLPDRNVVVQKSTSRAMLCMASTTDGGLVWHLHSHIIEDRLLSQSRISSVRMRQWRSF